MLVKARFRVKEEEFEKLMSMDCAIFYFLLFWRGVGVVEGY